MSNKFKTTGMNRVNTRN